MMRYTHHMCRHKNNFNNLLLNLYIYNYYFFIQIDYTRLLFNSTLFHSFCWYFWYNIHMGVRRGAKRAFPPHGNWD